MQLVDCFIELFSYTSYFINNVPSGQKSLEQLKTDLTHLIGKSQDNFHSSSLPQGDYDLARFAVLAWIDETILSSDWQEKGKWQGEQLQRTFYQTTDAGEIFFTKLNQLEPGQTQVREVYYLCLALGFTGRYCNPGDEFLLEQLKNSNLKLLGGAADFPEQTNKKLFPEAYSDRRKVKTKSSATHRFSAGLLVGAALPVLLYGVLFFLYRFVLSNVGVDFLTTIQ